MTVDSESIPSPDLEDIATIGQLIAAARVRLGVHRSSLIDAGAGQEVTVARNAEALRRLALVPRVLRDVSEIDLTTSLVGIPMKIPVFLAPVGSLANFHPADSAAGARAAEYAGTVLMCSMLTTSAFEDVVSRDSSRHILQVYVRGPGEWLDRVSDRAVEAGFSAICLTVDYPVKGRKDRLLAQGIEDRGGNPSNLVELENDRRLTASVTWRSLDRLCSRSEIPVIIKGIMNPSDAARAVASGVRGVYVSNHGGRALDHGLSTMEVLAETVDAVGDEVDIVVDGGFTGGADICKALALGAKAVGIGRLQCWALGLGGTPGISRLLNILEAELVITLGMLGCSNLAEMDPSLVAQSFAVSGNWSSAAPSASG